MNCEYRCLIIYEALENNSLHLHIVEAYGDGVYLSQIKWKSVGTVFRQLKDILLRHICG